MDEEYLTADEASALLGVSRNTLYAYVSRKRIRSAPVPGTRQRRYRRSDIEQVRLRPRGRPPSIPPGMDAESRISDLRATGLYFRGHNAANLAEAATFEEVAALLWEVEPSIFDQPAPRSSPMFGPLDDLLAGEAGVDRAIAHIPFLEQANPRGYDLSPLGMARTGVDIARWLTAIILNEASASDEPIHLQFEHALALQPEQTDLLRRVLVLAADHGINENTYAVRMIANTGVTPWRAVASGLAVAVGRQSRFGQNEALRRFIAEILAAAQPEAIVARQLKEAGGLPGFGSPVYSERDPRAIALLDFCERALHDDIRFRKLHRAIRFAEDFQALHPNFAFVSTFAEALTGLQSRRELVGLSSSEAPYLVGRSAGWVAHCIEQLAQSGGRAADSGD